ncbi:sigma-70 family RNA polymerase sigma factor [Yinghuangia soli]|uniref:Sigma-70 family RNA polymerase sigma factor n=1 Tax=Yinghuangia soli TaxID=2908204 RepID=A0AA41U3L2_9ACTN|nr:sigma-70 family RNA polymerase sigma factor [Yinghuangia soli]MCF2528164.1 sigma-70 family RNA polymerase sigma factor [Yinghuangia soli]
MDGETARITASDAELAQRVRDARPDADTAFAALHNRHHAAALRHARRIEPDPDAAEDLVSDAFVEVLAQLRRGGGPRESFRAYLCATMRNAQIDRVRARKAVVLTDDDAELDSLGGPAPQATEALPDLLMVQQAFGSLPDRWQAILWHTEVEGEKPRHIAGLMGMTPNAVSQLAVRAREGLSEAFLKAHIGRLPEHCRDYGTRLGGYVRGTLRIRDRRALDDHLAGCPTCTRVCAELAATNAHLRVVLLPAVLGAAAATAAAAEALAAAGAGAAAGTAAVTGGGAAADPVASQTADLAVKAGIKAAKPLAVKASVGGGVLAAVAAAVALAAMLTGGTPRPAAPDDRADLVAEPAPRAAPAASASAPAEAAPSASAPPTALPTPAAIPSASRPPVGTPPPDAGPTRSPQAPASTPVPPGTAAPEVPPARPATTPPVRPTTAPPKTDPPPPTVAVVPPVKAADDSITVVAGQSVSFNLLANDQGEKLYVVGSPIALGLYGNIACNKSSGACTYTTWTSLFSGTDVFSYTVRDAQNRYSTASIRIKVTAR